MLIEPRSSRLTDDVSSVLRSTVFSKCSDEEFDEVLEAAIVRVEPRRRLVVEQNQPLDYLGIVLEGVMGVTVLASGPDDGRPRYMRVSEAFPGALFGETALLDSGLALGRVSVLTKQARFVLVPRSVVLRLCERNHAFLLALARQAALRTRELTERLRAQASQSIISRVASVLLPYCEEGREELAPANPYLSEITQTDIASAAGTVKEVAARTIGQLEREGALVRERGRIRFLCRAKLSEFALTR
ncbi:MAG TPA: Crp/Fnr family transcriptional regulator [Candidatus Aquilonibacter sp.]|nr:Crp/Fnr family transcriptional regulator [Candidatus Aquilonibacter sp.]